jgi:hypothetical protein
MPRKRSEGFFRAVHLAGQCRGANFSPANFKYNVIRVADEILVDLMRSAGGIDYAEAAKDMMVREVDGVPIPFASPRLLWRMKAVTHREKDAGDLFFCVNGLPSAAKSRRVFEAGKGAVTRPHFLHPAFPLQGQGEEGRGKKARKNSIWSVGETW